MRINYCNRVNAKSDKRSNRSPLRNFDLVVTGNITRFKKNHAEEKAQTVGVQVSVLKVAHVGAIATGKTLTVASFLSLPLFKVSFPLI